MGSLAPKNTINNVKVAPQYCLSVGIIIYQLFPNFCLDSKLYIINTHWFYIMFVIKIFDGIFHTPDNTHYVWCVGDFPYYAVPKFCMKYVEGHLLFYLLGSCYQHRTNAWFHSLENLVWCVQMYMATAVSSSICWCVCLYAFTTSTHICRLIIATPWRAFLLFFQAHAHIWLELHSWHVSSSVGQFCANVTFYQCIYLHLSYLQFILSLFWLQIKFVYIVVNKTAIFLYLTFFV